MQISIFQKQSAILLPISMVSFYSTLSMEQQFWITAFITKYGLFQFTRMSFGLCNAPATYARAMQLVLRGLIWDIVLAFLDGTRCWRLIC
jgi:hypothetical protein